MGDAGVAVGEQRRGPGTLRLVDPAEAGDLESFLRRVVRLDPAALLRLRADGSSVTAYVWLPFGVAVSRSARVIDAPTDVTVAAADLLGAANRASGWAGAILLPAGRDEAWRGGLPPARGWRRVDRVPVDVLRRLVRVGAETLRAVGPRAATAGEALLDHPALSVTGGGRTVVLPLRVLSAAARMGFLGPPAPNASGDGADAPADTPTRRVLVSVSGGWVRLAAPYGSAYHPVTPALSVWPR